MIADMHCDTLSLLRMLRTEGQEIRLRDSGELHVNLEKMRSGDYLVQNFAVFVDLASKRDPFADAMDLIRLFETEMQENEDLIRPVTTVRQMEDNARSGRLSALLTLEEGEICGGDVGKLKELYRHGVRMMTLTWNYENCLASPATPMEFGETDPKSSAPDPKLPGLKEAGVRILEAMEHLGMIPDVSHLSDAGFYDVCKICRGPFVASHSNARALCSHGRNLTDDMLRLIGEHGGVAGLNFYPEFLSDVPDPEKGAELLAQHALHMADCGGRACVALGSDFDGFDGDCTPEGADHMEDLAWALHRAGFSDDGIDDIFCQNVLRVYQEVLHD